jgi:hypothetical protein
MTPSAAPSIAHGSARGMTEPYRLKYAPTPSRPDLPPPPRPKTMKRQKSRNVPPTDPATMPPITPGGGPALGSAGGGGGWGISALVANQREYTALCLSPSPLRPIFWHGNSTTQLKVPAQHNTSAPTRTGSGWRPKRAPYRAIGHRAMTHGHASRDSAVRCVACGTVACATCWGRGHARADNGALSEPP